MSSFTSRFRRTPKNTLIAAGAAVAAWAACYAYTTRGNPELSFWRQAYQAKCKWENGLDPARPKYVFCGGSSCAFQISPQALVDRFKIPAVNMGMHAGMGAVALTALALDHAKSGDTLVVSLEPGLLTERFAVTQLGYQALDSLGVGGALDPFDFMRPYHALLPRVFAVRPGLNHAATMAGKVLLGRPLYRYHAQDILVDGSVTTGVERTTTEHPREVLNFSADANAFLKGLAEYGRTARIRVIYSLPWALVASHDVERYQLVHLEFLEQVAAFIPVLADEQLGAIDRKDYFADTILHVTPAGAAARSEVVGKALIDERFWTCDDIRRAIVQRMERKASSPSNEGSR